MILLILNYSSRSQERKGFEEYYYPATGHLLPAQSVKIYDEGEQHWYKELRYNYEEQQTLACSVGKTFSKTGNYAWSFTPTIGVVAGKLQGISLGLNTSVTYKKLFFSSSALYSSCLEDGRKGFLFSWSELEYQVTKNFYAGFTMEQSCFYRACTQWEPGMQVGISVKNWIFPFYVFNPVGNHPYFTAGVLREWKK